MTPAGSHRQVSITHHKVHARVSNMAQSNRRRSRRKPAPRIRSQRKAAIGLPPEFPLFPHASGRWAKKIKGKFHWFGKVADDPKGEAALLRYLDQKDDLLAGRKPRPKGVGPTVAEMCDRFLQAKEVQRDAGELTPRSWNDYKATTDRIVAKFGRDRAISDLRPVDFEELRASLPKSWGLVSIGNFITRARVVLKYAYDSGLIDAPIRTGSAFKRPSKKTLRIQRAKAAPKLFSADDVTALLAKASPQMKAMILLGINCGFGNTDCASLELRHVDLDGGWIDYPRPKTGLHRRNPLWPETVEAIKAALATRKQPKAKEQENLVFVTRCGDAWINPGKDNAISKEFAKLAKALGIEQKGRGFYALRHTFRTIAGRAKDLEATRSLMGHINAHVEADYIEGIDDDRLIAVSDVVRAWLFPATPEQPTTQGSAERPSLRIVG